MNPIREFDEIEFKKCVDEIRTRNTGEGKSYNERQAIKKELNDEYDHQISAERKMNALKNQI